MTTQRVAAHDAGLRPAVRRRRLQLSAALHARPRLRLALLLGPPVLWIGVVYLGSLGALFVSAFWHLDPFTSLVQRDWGLSNFRTLWEGETYHTIVVRTVGIAAAVTVIDVLLAFPLAYYAARIASRRTRGLLLVLIVLPLWSSYLVRVFAWRTILADGGLLSWLSTSLHLGAVNIGYSNWAVLIVFSSLWLPFVVLPIYASIERVPQSMLDASADLGARAGRTFRAVVLPLAWPGVVAGSVFAFSLTLGDYIAPQLVGNTQFIGNVVYQNVGVANNLPLAAAFALVPVAVMAIYLALARRTGAFEAL